jgi:nitrogen regulatory protein P-II 1
VQSTVSLKKIEAIVRKEKFPDIDAALKEAGVGGVTFFDVEGRGRAMGMEMVSGRGAATYRSEYIERVKLEVLVKDTDVQKVVATITKVAKTGQVGDGKILVLAIENAWDITSGSSGSAAI